MNWGGQMQVDSNQKQQQIAKWSALWGEYQRKPEPARWYVGGYLSRFIMPDQILPEQPEALGEEGVEYWIMGNQDARGDFPDL